MYHLTLPDLPQATLGDRPTVSHDKSGSGPSLVLVHGSFSDHKTNWEFVKHPFEQQFTVYAIARRDRGETEMTSEHSLEDESLDVVMLIQAIDEPVFLLGHSYGAQVALAAAAKVPDRVRKLVLYEAPWPHILSKESLARLETLTQADHWDDFAVTFFRDSLFVPVEALDELRTTELWQPIIADAKATLGDLQALARYDFNAEHFRELRVPVLLQIGTESPRDLYITDTIAAVLPDVRIEALPGQSHEGMTTAPRMYAEVVSRFLLGRSQSMQKKLYILIGPKGAGKTHIGSRVNQHTSIQFLRVEAIWLQLTPCENGWEVVEQAIDQAFQQYDEVMIESLGAGSAFDRFHASLMGKYNVKRIKVATDLAECLKRVKNRNNSHHIPVSDEKVEEYNRIVAGVHHEWDAIIDNNALVTDEEILKVIESLRSS